MCKQEKSAFEFVLYTLSNIKVICSDHLWLHLGQARDKPAGLKKTKCSLEDIMWFFSNKESKFERMLRLIPFEFVTGRVAQAVSMQFQCSVVENTLHQSVLSLRDEAASLSLTKLVFVVVLSLQLESRFGGSECSNRPGTMNALLWKRRMRKEAESVCCSVCRKPTSLTWMPRAEPA